VYICQLFCLPTAYTSSQNYPNPNLVCRCLDALAPLLLLLFSAGPAAAGEHTTPSKQQQQQQQQQKQSDALALSQDRVQLQTLCYGLLNQLIGASCVGSEQQLLVLPMAVGELLQDRLAEGGVLTGEGGEGALSCERVYCLL
jgi:hypothetical protein